MFKIENDRNISAWRQTLSASLLLALLIGLIYSNSLNVPFLFDDYCNIERNPNILVHDLSWTSISKTFYGINRIGTRYIRPFAYLSFALNYHFGGFDVRGYHIVNLLIHFLTALFLFLFVRETLELPTFKGRYRDSAYSAALLASVIWATHPIQTQAVTYIVQRMASMAALFYLASFYFYLKGRICTSNKRWLYFLGAMTAAVLSFGTKENTAVLPVAIVCYEFLFFQHSIGPGQKKKVLLAVAIAVLIPILLGMFFQGATVFHAVWEEIQKGYPDRNFTAYERVLTELRVVLFYLSLLAYPGQHHLTLDHDFSVSHSLFDPITTLLSGVTILALIAAAFILARKRPLISFCIFWYFLNLVIESSVFNLELVFEHRLYLPSMSLALLLAVVIMDVLGRVDKPEKKLVAVSLVCFFIILQGNGTYVRNFVWESEFSLWTDCYAKAPNKPRTIQNLGFAYSSLGQYDKAEEFLTRSLSMEPNNENTLNSLGMVYLEKNQFEKALSAFRKAEKISPRWITPVSNQGVVYYRLGKYDEAEREYKRSLSIEPAADSCDHLGMVYLVKNHPREAMACFKKVIDNQPSYIKSLFHMGLACKMTGMHKEALYYLNRFLERQPGHPDVLLAKAETCAEMGDQAGKIKALGELLQYHPFHYTANLLIGKKFLEKRDYSRAKICLRTAASVNETESEPFSLLARLYKETGKENLAEYYEKTALKKPGRKSTKISPTFGNRSS